MQTITTPTGDTLVVLPLADYERLLDQADIAEARAIQEAGGEKLTAEMVKRLVAGENPIRVWREHRGMTSRDLATKAELSAAYISEIETGKKDGSISAVRRIAEALGVEIDDLV